MPLLNSRQYPLGHPRSYFRTAAKQAIGHTSAITPSSAPHLPHLRSGSQSHFAPYPLPSTKCDQILYAARNGKHKRQNLRQSSLGGSSVGRKRRFGFFDNSVRGSKQPLYANAQGLSCRQPSGTGMVAAPSKVKSAYDAFPGAPPPQYRHGARFQTSRDSFQPLTSAIVGHFAAWLR